jgi:hypothetical protein
MKDLGVVEPDSIIGNGVKLSRLIFPLLKESILVVSNPSRLRSTFFVADLLNLIPIRSRKELSPRKHCSNIKRPFLTNSEMCTLINDLESIEFCLKSRG